MKGFIASFPFIVALSSIYKCAPTEGNLRQIGKAASQQAGNSAGRQNSASDAPWTFEPGEEKQWQFLGLQSGCFRQSG
jgi:hypothetical protein